MLYITTPRTQAKFNASKAPKSRFWEQELVKEVKVTGVDLTRLYSQCPYVPRKEGTVTFSHPYAYHILVKLTHS